MKGLHTQKGDKYHNILMQIKLLYEDINTHHEHKPAKACLELIAGDLFSQ